MRGLNITEMIMGFVMLIVSFALSMLIRYIKSAVSESAWQDAVAWVELAVSAAEQMYKGVPKSGDKKYEYAYDMLKDLDIDDAQKNMLIEAAVKKLS